MVPGRLSEAFLENPEYLLALMLSAPAEQSKKSYSSITVEFSETEVLARVPRPSSLDVGPRLLATKSTILAAILMHQLVIQRGPEFADSLVERARTFSASAANRQAKFEPHIIEGIPAQSDETEGFTFFRELEAGSRIIQIAQQDTKAALDFLEEEGLAIDPGFTPTIVILAGLIPMQFSVRTPKGERIYREIKINAPLWSLGIAHGRQDQEPFTDIEFTFRGILIVRKAVIAMATQYLESEEKVRRVKGQKVLKRKGSLEFDVD